MNGVQALSAIENRSTAVIIADQLREGIVAGTFVSGDQINEAQLAERLQVSRGPVREALHRLVQEGLLEGRPNRGVFVKEVTRRDIAEVAEAREVIECAAAEVITAMGDAERDRIAGSLLAATEPMAAAFAAGDRDRLRRARSGVPHAARPQRQEHAAAAGVHDARHRGAHLHAALRWQRDRRGPIASHVHIAELLRSGDMEAVHAALHEHLSIDELDLHSHDEETLRHGRVEG